MVDCLADKKRQAFNLNGIDVVYSEPHLTIKVDGATAVDQKFPAWKIKEVCMDDPKLPANHPSCGGSCSNPGYLGAVYTDEARSMVMVSIGYCNTSDICPFPEGHYHIFKLRK